MGETVSKDAGNLPYRKRRVSNEGCQTCRGPRDVDGSKIHKFRNDMDDLAIHARSLVLANGERIQLRLQVFLGHQALSFSLTH